MKRIVLLLIYIVITHSSGLCQVVEAPHIQAELISEFEDVVAAKSYPLALRLKPDKDWHVYWKNPGDSGLAPTLAWHLPKDWTEGALNWPTPKKIAFGPLVNFGYEEETLIISEPQVSKDASGEVKISLDAEWLVCSEECIPGNASFTLSRKVSDHLTPTKWSQQFSHARSMWPATHVELPISAARQDDAFLIELPKNVAKKDLFFFPEVTGLIENAAAQTISIKDDKAQLKIERAHNSKKTAASLKGLLVGPKGWLGNTPAQSIEVDLALEPQAVNALANQSQSAASDHQVNAGTETDTLTFLPALLFALIGGLILNLMPCIFPVLSIKILGFVEQSSGDLSAARKHGLLFGAGVLISFWILAASLIFLRASGAGLGWGFQLQDPHFITLLALLIFALSLNLLGVFELGEALQRSVGRVNIDTSYSGSFFSGVLATVLATPCTAPFMGSALAYALTVSPLGSIAVFSALGIGMALPYVILSFSPRLLKFLPRPGEWMVTFKQLMAFPLLLTVLWLAWVLGLQTDLDTVIRLLTSFVMLGFAAWLVGRFGGVAAPNGQRFSVRIASVALLVAAYLLPSSNPPIERSAATGIMRDSHGLEWQPYSEELIKKLRSENRAIYVDFTAAWCLTCQVNKRIVFNSTEVLELLAQKNVALVRADWTKRDPEITQALARYNRSGVPLNLLFFPGKDMPEILPAILTPGLVAQELAKL